jgi:hypothetical protein
MYGRADVYIGLMLAQPALPAAVNGGVPTEPSGSGYASAVAAVRVGDLDSARSILSLLAGDVPVSAGPLIDMDLSNAASLKAASLNAASLNAASLNAAGLYAGVLAALGYPRAALGYSTYAYDATRAATPSGSDPQLQAALAHAYVLRATGDPAAAASVGRDLVRGLIARFGATDRRTLAGHADLAVTLHALGECLSGRQILHRTGEVFRQTYGPDDPLAVRMIERFATLTRTCGASDVQRVIPAEAILAEHVCGQRARRLSVPTADLFLDLFAFIPTAATESSSVDPAAAVDSPPVAVPTSVEPTSVGPESVGPESVGPESVGPQPAEPMATAVDAVEPESVECEPMATAVDAARPNSDDAGRRELDAALADATGAASVRPARPAVGPAGLLAALAKAIPAARPTAPRSSGPDLVEAEVTPVPVPTVAVPAPAPTVPVDDTVAASEVTATLDAANAANAANAAAAGNADAADAQVVAEALDAAARSAEPSAEPVDFGVDSGADAEDGLRDERHARFRGDAEPVAAVGDDRAADEPPIPMWADRPTAGYPTVPVATGLHPTWVTASEVPFGAGRPTDETSTVAVVDNVVAEGSLTHSRATFGRMRRRLNHNGAADRPQQTATARSAKTTDGE